MENKPFDPALADGEPVADRTTFAASHHPSAPPPPDPEPDAELHPEATPRRPAAALKVVAGAAAAVGLTAGAVALLNAQHQDAEPPEGDLPEDSTLYQLPVAHQITDAMSFSEAFGTARADVGPDGLFYWHGEWYSCHTLEEFGRLSPSDSHHIQPVALPQDALEAGAGPAGPPPVATLAVLPVTPGEELPDDLLTETEHGTPAAGLSGGGAGPAIPAAGAATGTASGRSPAPEPSPAALEEPAAAINPAPAHAPRDSDYDGVDDSQDYFPLDASLS